MKSIFIVALLLAVSSVSGFGGCGCGRNRPPPTPPPCEATPAPSCEEVEAEVCTPCPVIPRKACPICPESVEYKCRDCPKVVIEDAPPCPVCAPQPKCDVCPLCPEQPSPAPCPGCPSQQPPAQCPVCPEEEEAQEVQCPSQPPLPTASCSRRPPPPPQFGNDCCNKCGNNCFLRRRLRAHAATTLVTNVDPMCNSEKLRNIILNNIADNITESKRAIQKLANEKLSGFYDVICGKGDLSYVISSNKFCQETKNDITCYVFRQS